MKKHLVIFLSLFLMAPVAQTVAQESTLLHFMRQSPQSLRSNPANLLDSTKFFMGIPFLSNINVDLNFGFAYSDAIYRDAHDDSLRINRSIVDQLTGSSRMGVDFNYELLSFGARFREDNMITFSLSAKAFGTFLFPKDVATLLVEGNEPDGVLSIDSDVNASAYVEAALGYSRIIDKHWKVGVRVKYLAGIANAYSDRMNISVATDADYALKLSSDALLRTSILDLEDNPLKNSGMAFDAGVYYKSPVKGLELSFSLVDWGYIQWNSDRKAFRSEVKNGVYEFKGITDVTDNNVNAILDTLKNVLEFNEIENPDAYSSPLLGKIFFGASYDFSNYDKVGFLFSTRALQHFSRTTFALMYSRRVGNWFTVAAGNNFMTQKLFNPSLALHFRTGNFQFHIAGENISSFYLKDISTANIQFGMNIAIY
ncbi:MAG: DUF5723 family protein [Prevotellaceae bacterium]|jgi:hypothetical protein|nr:DUF5723 family protein [Prevotellaceae bacterium]